MVYNVVHPFIQSGSPEEAKKLLLDSMKNQKLDKNLHKAIFTKVTLQHE